MKKLWSIFVLLFVALFAVKATNTNYLTHCLTSGTAKPFVIQWDFYYNDMWKVKSHEQFLKDLWDKNEYYRKGKFEVVGNYIGTYNSILCKNKYGLLNPLPKNLLKGCEPTIKCAVDRNTYFANQAREIHGERYKYDKINYKRNDSEVEITCSIHGSFWQQPVCHLLQKQGCPHCNTILFYENRNLDTLKDKVPFIYFYIINLRSKNENFYKVGLTTNPIRRFKEFGDYEVLVEICDKMDVSLGIKNEEYFLTNYEKYVPNIFFSGHTECLKENPLYYEYSKNFYKNANYDREII